MKSLAVCLTLLIVILPQWASGQSAAPDFSELYEQASPAIVTIHTESGSGSGFLVTPFGHIATNYHVVRSAHYLAVQFSDGRKVGAEIVATNASGDMALIKVNSSVVNGIRPLPLLSEDKDSTIKVGIPVVAIGSPQVQDFVMTKGILSKLSDTTLFGDYTLQPGNSGGPLMNNDGEVIGMNTFIDGSIAGSLRIDALRYILDSPMILETAPIEPSADLLPAIRPERYPTDILNLKVAHEKLNLEAYRFKAGDFQITTITPVLIGKVRVMQDRKRAANQFSRRNRNVADSGSQTADNSFFNWNQSAGETLAFAVRFAVEPISGQTKQSKWLKTVPRVVTFGKSGKLDMEFKGEFLEFRLYRDGELIQPITPGRFLMAGSPQNNSRFIDQAYAGLYVYDPAVFMDGNEFRLEIVDARRPEAVHKTLVFSADSPLIRQIRSDFSYQPPTVVAVGAH